MTPLDRLTALLCAAGVAMAGAALAIGARVQNHPASAAMRHAARHHHTLPPQPLTIPIAIDPVAAAAVIACGAAIALWCWWQRSHRCDSCGYCPIWCRCHELPDRAPR